MFDINILINIQIILIEFVSNECSIICYSGLLLILSKCSNVFEFAVRI